MSDWRVTLEDLEEQQRERERKPWGFLFKYSPPGVGYNWYYTLTHPWEIPVAYWEHLKAFWQRGRRGYADRDVWGLDEYLASWMPDALRQLKDTTNSIPAGLSQSTGGNTDEALVVWKDILEQMAQGFEAASTLMEMDYDVRDLQERKLLEAQMKKGLGFFRQYFLDLWD